MAEERIITPLSEINIDMQAAADSLFLGPQADLLEKIQHFNSRYGRYNTTGDIIQINRNYGFKPGVYDRIKEAFGNHCLVYRSKPKDMWSLRYRMDNNRWQQRDFWRDAIAIQSQMKSLKYNNVGWQDNIEVVERFFNELQERIPNDVENALTIFTNDNIEIGVEQSNEDDWGSMKIIIEIFTADIDMKVFHQEEEIANYRWGNMSTKWNVPFWKFINNWCEGGMGSRYNSGIGNPHAKLYPKYPKLRHPYVSNNSYQTDINDWNQHTCTGDLQSDLKESVWALDINAICSLTRSWLSRYHIPRTNPLNRIQFCYYGWETGMDSKIWSHSGTSETTFIESCQWPNVFSELYDYNEENPCDNCEFQTEHAYLINASEIPEDSEYPGQRVIVIEPCYKAIREYETPLTDDDIIKEACIMHLTCCHTLRNMPGINQNEPALDYMLSENNRFPIDANLETIHSLNPEFNLSNAFRAEQHSWPVQGTEDLLDIVFNTRIWEDLVNEYVDLFQLSEGDVEDAEYDLRNESLESIRDMINREMERREGNHPRQPAWDPLAVTHENGNLTPEELTIRWATERGRTINI